MTKKVLLIVSLLFTAYGNAQSNERPLTPDLESDPTSTVSVDVELYTIKLDDASIPLTLSYNTNGIRVNEMPGSLGLSWKIKDIGKISRFINHLPDDLAYSTSEVQDITSWTRPEDLGQIKNMNGWLFSKDGDPIPYYYSQESVGFRSKYVDLHPDFFSLNTQMNLNSLFVYKKVFNSSNAVIGVEPIFMQGNAKCTVNTNFDNFHFNVNNYDDIVFEIRDENGFQYGFTGGPVQETIAYSDNKNKYKDYYLKNIRSTFNSDEINIDYIENFSNVFIWMHSGSYNRSENRSETYLQNYGYKTNNILDYKEIRTPREIIKFSYNTIHVGGSDYGNQDKNQLVDISIYNLQGEFVTGYFFEYNYLPDNRFILSRINKYNKSKTDYVMFREFQYYDGAPNSRTSYNQDMFGFSNEPSIANINLLPVENKDCPGKPGGPPTNYRAAADRSFNLPAMLRGMLKKVVTNLGGITEYTYQANADSQYYGGGLVVSRIAESPQFGRVKTTNYRYENLKGLVLPLSNYKEYFLQQFTNYPTELASNLPFRYYDTDALDYNQAFLYYKTQKSGNYFSKVKTTTDFDFYEIEGEEAPVSLAYTYEYAPNYEGIIRFPMVKKKTLSKEYYFQGTLQNTEFLSSEERIYDFSSTSNIRGLESNFYTRAVCFPGEDGPGGESSLQIRPVYLINQPIRQIISKDFAYTPAIETKKEFSYLGDSGSPYPFDQLKPKQIITYKNNVPFTKQKFKYLFEMATASSGLGSSQFITPALTLLFENSEWRYNTDGQWTLKEAEFNQYFNDGKLKRLSKVHKNQSSNTLYNEQNFQPEIYQGYQVNVTEENVINLTYDGFGKLTTMQNVETGDTSVFSRANDKDSYMVNTIVKGNQNLSGNFTFYRNSFESNASNTISTPIAYTGSKVYNAASLQAGTFPSGYIVSYWCYINNKWEFRSSTHAGGIVTITPPTGATYIDEVWVRPANTTLTGFTFDPLIGKTSTIEDSGLVIKTLYDQYNREEKQADQDNNLLHKKQYNLIFD